MPCSADMQSYNYSDSFPGSLTEDAVEPFMSCQGHQMCPPAEPSHESQHNDLLTEQLISLLQQSHGSATPDSMHSGELPVVDESDIDAEIQTLLVLKQAKRQQRRRSQLLLLQQMASGLPCSSPFAAECRGGVLMGPSIQGFDSAAPQGAPLSAFSPQTLASNHTCNWSAAASMGMPRWQNPSSRHSIDIGHLQHSMPPAAIAATSTANSFVDCWSPYSNPQLPSAAVCQQSSLSGPLPVLSPSSTSTLRGGGGAAAAVAPLDLSAVGLDVAAVLGGLSTQDLLIGSPPVASGPQVLMHVGPVSCPKTPSPTPCMQTAAGCMGHMHWGQAAHTSSYTQQQQQQQQPRHRRHSIHNGHAAMTSAGMPLPKPHSVIGMNPVDTVASRCGSYDELTLQPGATAATTFPATGSAADGSIHYERMPPGLYRAADSSSSSSALLYQQQQRQTMLSSSYDGSSNSYMQLRSSFDGRGSFEGRSSSSFLGGNTTCRSRQASGSFTSQQVPPGLEPISATSSTSNMAQAVAQASASASLPSSPPGLSPSPPLRPFDAPADATADAAGMVGYNCSPGTSAPSPPPPPAAAVGGEGGSKAVGATSPPPAAATSAFAGCRMQQQQHNCYSREAAARRSLDSPACKSAAPKWAGAFWHPLAEVVKNGQAGNKGTGVFLPGISAAASKK